MAVMSHKDGVIILHYGCGTLWWPLWKFTGSNTPFCLRSLTPVELAFPEATGGIVLGFHPICLSLCGKASSCMSFWAGLLVACLLPQLENRNPLLDIPASDIGLGGWFEIDT